MRMPSIGGELLYTIRMFCTRPAAAAGGERAFHKVRRMNDYLSSTMCQDRLSSLTILSIQYEEARKLDFNYIIDYFARMEVWQRAL